MDLAGVRTGMSILTTKADSKQSVAENFNQWLQGPLWCPLLDWGMWSLNT